MRTDDLIDALARDPVPALPSVGAQLGRAVAITAPLALGLLLLTLGVREDAFEALPSWFGVKLALLAVLAGSGWMLAMAAAKPGRAPPLAWPALFAAALALAMVADIALEGRADWVERLVGDNAALCLVTIPLLSILPLGGALLALRDGAPTRPAFAGAAAGLLAGGIGATLYGLHCTDDSPLFLGMWYLLAIALVAAAGAAIGRRVLRW